MKGHSPFDAICWAQGLNLNDDIFTVSIDSHREIYRSNVEYIFLSLQALLNKGLVKDGQINLIKGYNLNKIDFIFMIGPLVVIPSSSKAG